MAIDEDEIKYLIELRETIKRNLRALNIKKAGFGSLGGPAHLDVEIAQATKEVAVLDAKLSTVQLSEEVVNAVGPIDASTLLLDYRVKQLDQRMNDGLRHIVEQVKVVAEQVTRIDAVTEERWHREQEVRAQRQQEHDARMTAMEETQEAVVSKLAQHWWIDALLILALVGAVAFWIANR